jgi:hypothetical protein
VAKLIADQRAGLRRHEGRGRDRWWARDLDVGEGPLCKAVASPLEAWLPMPK